MYSVHSCNMTKAEFTTNGGMKIILDGSPREIAEILEEFERRGRREEERRKMAEEWSKRRREERNKSVHSISERVPSLTGIIISLVEKGFFDKSRIIKEIMAEIEKEGVSPPSSTVHPLLSRLVAHGKLKREKGETGVWEYKKK